MGLLARLVLASLVLLCAPSRAFAQARDASLDGSLADAAPDAIADVTDGGSSDASADDREARRARAAQSFAQGMEAYRRGDFLAATTSFEDAYSALPDPAPLFNMARSFEGANDIARAIDSYRRYLDAAGETPDRADVIARIELLRARPTEIFISTQPPGAFVFVDGSAEPQPSTTPMVLRLAPGRHTVTFVREGHSRAERAIEVQVGQRQTVSVPLRADEEPVGSRGRLDPAVLDRRLSTPWASRFSAFAGAARPYPGQALAFAVGGEGTLFYGRYFTMVGRFTRIEPDGSWTLLSFDAGATYPLEDIDLGAFLSVGAGYGYVSYDDLRMMAPLRFTPTLGAEVRADWFFHRRLSLGVFFRLDLRNWFVATIDPMASFGLGLSLNP